MGHSYQTAFRLADDPGGDGRRWGDVHDPTHDRAVRPETTPPARPDWGLGEAHAPLPLVGPAAVLFGPGALVALGVAVVAGPLWGAVVLIAYLGGAALLVMSRGRRVLRVNSAEPVPPGSEPRLENLVAGIARDLGMAPPTLWVLPEEGPNALIGPHGPHLGLTRGLLDSYTRTELEAVVAHCLVRLREARVARLSLALLMGRAPAAGVKDDVRAAEVTRYPPALHSAIAKARPQGGRDAPLWFVAEAPGEADRQRRLEALSDL